MADNPALFLFVRFLTVLTSLGLAIAVYLREANSPGRRILSLVLVLGAIWVISDGLEVSTNFDAKVLANKIQHTAVLLLPAVWLLAAGAIVLPVEQRRWTTAYAIGTSFLGTLIIFTNEYHHLFWAGMGFAEGSRSAPLIAIRGEVFWVLLLHTYLVMSASIVTIVLTGLRLGPLHLWRAAGLVVAGLLPALAGIMDALASTQGGALGHDFDLTPYALMIAIPALSFAWPRLYRADLLPAARARLVASFSDAILVLNRLHQIIDLNPSAERLLSCPARDATGKSVQTFLPNLPLMAEDRIEAEGQALEYILGNSPQQRIFDMRVSYLQDRKGRALSPIIVLHEITTRKKTELAIRQRNEELATLTEVGQALNQLAEPEAMLELIFVMIGRVVDSSNLYIALYDEERQWIDFPVYTMRGTRREPGGRIPGNGLTEYVLRTKAPLLINEELVAVLPTLGIVPFGALARSYLGVPMLVGEKAIGVIAIQDYEKEHAYEENHVSVLMTTAAQAASALTNAQLYDRAQREILERKRAEEHLRASLAEKEVLLKEIHHRVKNNLQVISSLLNLQSGSIRDPLLLAQFQDSQNRIRSMALIHERLYRSGDLAHIDFGPYLRDLTGHLQQTYRAQSQAVELRVESDAVLLDIDTAIPCGLLVNELVSNALKHAFPDKRGGTVEVELRRHSKEQYRLAVRDDGIGMPADIDWQHTSSLGLQLVNSLARQVDGTVELQSASGTAFSVCFPEGNSRRTI